MSHPDFNVVYTTISSIRYPQFDQKWVLTTKNDVSLLDVGCYQHRPAIKVGSWPTTHSKKKLLSGDEMVIFKKKWFPVVKGKRRKTKRRERCPPKLQSSGHGIISVQLHGCMCTVGIAVCRSLLERFPTHLQRMWEVWCSDGEHRRSWKHNIRALTDVQMFNAMVLWEDAFRIGMNMNDGWWLVGWLQNIWWYYLAELGMMTIDDQYCNQNANVQLTHQYNEMDYMDSWRRCW